MTHTVFLLLCVFIMIFGSKGHGADWIHCTKRMKSASNVGMSRLFLSTSWGDFICHKQQKCCAQSSRKIIAKEAFNTSYTHTHTYTQQHEWNTKNFIDSQPQNNKEIFGLGFYFPSHAAVFASSPLFSSSPCPANSASTRPCTKHDFDSFKHSFLPSLKSKPRTANSPNVNR